MSEQESKNPVSDYATFIKDKHERLFNTPHEIIEAAILKATGSSVIGKDRIIKGEANEVHLIETEDGQEVIIRIGHHGWSKVGFQKERWALEQCHNAGLPVPTVLHLETLELEGQPLSICVENKLPGTPLNDIENIKSAANESRLEELIKKSGEILAKIHSIKTDGFGELDAQGKGEKNSVADTLDNEWIQEDNVLRVAKIVDLDPKIVLRALEILRQERVKHQIETPSLIHSDYVPKHIMVDNNDITGIIDFENAIGGDPIKDFAYWDFFSSNEYSFEALKSGYTDKSLFNSDFERRLAMWKIYLGLNNLTYYESEKNQGGINHCKKSLTRDIKLF